jgi:hypothetical protein
LKDAKAGPSLDLAVETLDGVRTEVGQEEVTEVENLKG